MTAGMTVDEWYPSEGSQILDADEVKYLAALVTDRLAELRDPRVCAPTAAGYRANVHWQPHNMYGLSVDIDIGPTVLTLRRQAAPWKEGDRWDVPRLANWIFQQVQVAHSDTSGLAVFEDVAASLRAKLKRERSDIELLSVRPGPYGIGGMYSLAGQHFHARLRLLDNMLLFRPHLIMGRTIRSLCHEVACLTEAQRSRRIRLDRLQSTGAVLEIDAMAEFAIVASGLKVVDVVRTLLDRHRRGRGQWMTVNLLKGIDDWRVQVCAGDGLISMSASLPPLTWKGDEGLISLGLPETVKSALVGKSLSTLIDHPLLSSAARISFLQDYRDSSVKVGVERDRRPIRRDEVPYDEAALREFGYDVNGGTDS